LCHKKLSVHGTISQLLTNIAFKTAKNTIFNDKKCQKNYNLSENSILFFLINTAKYLPSAFGAGICL